MNLLIISNFNFLFLLNIHYKKLKNEIFGRSIIYCQITPTIPNRTMASDKPKKYISIYDLLREAPHCDLPAREKLELVRTELQAFTIMILWCDVQRLLGCVDSVADQLEMLRIITSGAKIVKASSLCAHLPDILEKFSEEAIRYQVFEDVVRFLRPSESAEETQKIVAKFSANKYRVLNKLCQYMAADEYQALHRAFSA